MQPHYFVIIEKSLMNKIGEKILNLIKNFIPLIEA